MKFDVKLFKELAQKDFEKAWIMGKELLEPRDPNRTFPRLHFKSGTEHPLFKTIQMLRETYLSLGFDEVVNPIIVEDIHIRRQFGKEALAVLDRCFYLATLPKPNIGISQDRVELIGKIIGRMVKENELEELRNVFHLYKKGKIDGDDLSYEVARALNTNALTAIRILDEVFPEFKALKPSPLTFTLRSHMTTGWFITLSKIADELPLPIKLFSIDRCFRREQGEDATRLYSYFSASCVYVDEDVSIEEGKAVAEALLRRFGFTKFRFRPDDKNSKYYVPGTQTEVFAFHPQLVGSKTKYSDGWIEIATFGIYSPSALAEYGIEYPVMNLGLGVERLAMILHGYSDVRQMVYPYLYNGVQLDDAEIARHIRLNDVPETPTGMKMALAIVNTAKEYCNAKSPCEFLAFEGQLHGRTIRAYVVEREPNTKLCGPAFLNEIVVHKSSVYGIPRNEKYEKYFKEGISTGITYIESFAFFAARQGELAALRGEDTEVRVRVVEGLSDINLTLQENVRRFISSSGGKIDVRGPMFVTVRFEVDED